MAPSSKPVLTSPPRRSQSQRRAEAEQRIIESAIKIIANKGLSGLTLAAAGEGAGYSRGIASHHFGKKDELLIATIRFIMKRFSDFLEADPNTEAGLPMLLAIIRRYLEGVEDSSRIRAFLLILMEGVNNPALTPAIAKANERAVRGIEANLRYGIEHGQIRKDINPRAQAVILLASLRGVMAQWLVDDVQVQLDAVAREFVNSVRRSLSP